jgi:DNA-binding CsgD family transcriptional regulator
LGDRILTNIKKIMIPNLERLQKSRLSPRNRHILDLIQTNIEEITSPFVKSLSSAYIDLSPNEIQVADLIRQGKHTKEIAAIMNLSENTIMTHRFHIRTKLGLKNKKTNLQTFLTSIG